MNLVLKLIPKLNDDELLTVSEAVDMELTRRMERADPIPESARRRANERQHSYRHSNGAAAPPISLVGLRKPQRRRFAA